MNFGGATSHSYDRVAHTDGGTPLSPSGVRTPRAHLGGMYMPLARGSEASIDSMRTVHTATTTASGPTGRSAGKFLLKPPDAGLDRGGVSPSTKVKEDQNQLRQKVGSSYRPGRLLPRYSQGSGQTAMSAGEEAPREYVFADNIMAGFLAGVQLVMGAMVCATLTWTSGNIDSLTNALPVGISMNVVGLMILIAVTCSFSAVPYALPAVQDTPSLMLGAFARSVVDVAPEDKVVHTMLFMMALLAVCSGVLYILMGIFRVCEWVQQLPHSVISGFLGAIGIWVTVSALALMSGVRFVCIYPTDWGDFFQPHSMAQISLGTVFFLALQLVPKLAGWCMSQKAAMKVSHLITIIPLPIFWAAIFGAGISVDALEEKKWIFPRSSESVSCTEIWEIMYSWYKVDMDTIWKLRFDMCTFLAVMCLNAVLGFTGIEASRGSEKSVLDHNREIVNLGVANIAAGSLTGQCGYHQIPLSVYAHNAGLHNRLGAYTAAFVALMVHSSGVPLQAIMPKWFLGGIFLNMGFLFLKQWLYEALFTMPMLEYIQIWIVALVAVWTSFPNAALVGITISMIMFVRDATMKDPIKSVRRLDQLSHKAAACLPDEDLEVLEEIGHEAVWIAFQGDLFFGNAKILYDSLLSIFASYTIWDFKDVRSVDVAAAEMLRNAATIIKTRGSHVTLSQITPSCRDVLALEGLCDARAKTMSSADELELDFRPVEKGKRTFAQTLPCDCGELQKSGALDALEYCESIEEALSFVNQLLLDADKSMRTNVQMAMLKNIGTLQLPDTRSSMMSNASERSMERQMLRDQTAGNAAGLKLGGIAKRKPNNPEKSAVVTNAWRMIKEVGTCQRFAKGDSVFRAGDKVNDTFYAIESGLIDIIVFMYGYSDRMERVQSLEVFGVEGYILHLLNRQETAVCSSDDAVIWSITRESVETMKDVRAHAYHDLQEFLLRMLASSVRQNGRM